MSDMLMNYQCSVCLKQVLDFDCPKPCDCGAPLDAWKPTPKVSASHVTTGVFTEITYDNMHTADEYTDAEAERVSLDNDLKRLEQVRREG